MQDSPSGSSEVTPEVEIDLDEVLDLDGDAMRRKFIRSILINAKKSQDEIEVSITLSLIAFAFNNSIKTELFFFQKFIDDLLEKAKTL